MPLINKENKSKFGTDANVGPGSYDYASADKLIHKSGPNMVKNWLMDTSKRVRSEIKRSYNDEVGPGYYDNNLPRKQASKNSSVFASMTKR